MNHLSGMDASFLHLESPEMPMHVGSLQILDLPDGQAGVAIAKALLSDSPNPPPVKPPRSRLRTNQYQLGVAELAAAALSNSLTQAIKLARSLPEVLEALVSVLYPKPEGGDGKRK